jgi:hypothetical protein
MLNGQIKVLNDPKGGKKYQKSIKWPKLGLNDPKGY